MIASKLHFNKEEVAELKALIGWLYLDVLFEEFNKPYVVVTFLSILEMVKERGGKTRDPRCGEGGLLPRKHFLPRM